MKKKQSDMLNSDSQGFPGEILATLWEIIIYTSVLLSSKTMCKHLTTTLRESKRRATKPSVLYYNVEIASLNHAG